MTILMTHAADILVIFASLGAMLYCMILSRRLSRLTSFDKGLGSAIAVMSSQVDEMKSALREAKAGSEGAGQQLSDLVSQARDISSELEMMIAACHDFAEEAIAVQSSAGGVDGAAMGPDEIVGQDISGDLDEAHGVSLHQDAEIEHMHRTTEASSGLDDQSAEVTPMFGSRRTVSPDRTVEPPAEPLFRRRRNAAS